MNLAEHPTVRHFHESHGERPGPPSRRSPSMRRGCVNCASTAGPTTPAWSRSAARPWTTSGTTSCVSFLPAKTLLSFVCRMNREPIRSPARSVANLEFHHTGDHVNEVARKIVATLERQGVRALNPAMGFPMEMDRFPGGKIWVVSHKPVAVAAGLGHMGIHRNVIHPKFGNFILLGTVLIAAEATAYDQPLSYNPCLECKLCVAACPVGAISPDGDFNFSACYTHNYREFMGGFTDWVEQIADSKNALDYRKKVTDPESASMWQSLSFGAELQGGVLPERLPGWGRCHRPLPHRQGRASAGSRSSVAGEGGDGLRRRRLGRRGACGPPLPAQDDQTGRQRPAAPVDPALLVGAAL